MLDFILVVILTTGFAAVVSRIIGYDKQTNLLQTYYDKYEQLYLEPYGIDLDITQEDYDKLTPEQKTIYQEQVAKMETAMKDDAEVLAIYEKLITFSIVIISSSVLLAILSVYFVVPLFFKHGQTIGKKVFGLAVIRSNCVKASNGVLFVRILFGLYAIETMFPIMLLLMTYFGILTSVGPITVLGLAILQIVVIVRSNTNSCIHDLLSDTIVVDFASQQVFETNEEREEWIKAEQARLAAEAEKNN